MKKYYFCIFVVKSAVHESLLDRAKFQEIKCSAANPHLSFGYI